MKDIIEAHKELRKTLREIQGYCATAIAFGLPISPSLIGEICAEAESKTAINLTQYTECEVIK